MKHRDSILFWSIVLLLLIVIGYGVESRAEVYVGYGVGTSTTEYDPRPKNYFLYKRALEELEIPHSVDIDLESPSSRFFIGLRDQNHSLELLCADLGRFSAKAEVTPEFRGKSFREAYTASGEVSGIFGVYSYAWDGLVHPLIRVGIGRVTLDLETRKTFGKNRTETKTYAAPLIGAGFETEPFKGVSLRLVWEKVGKINHEASIESTYLGVRYEF